MKLSGLQLLRCESHKAGSPSSTSEGNSVVVGKEHDHPPQSTMQLAIVDYGEEGQRRDYILDWRISRKRVKEF